MTISLPAHAPDTYRKIISQVYTENGKRSERQVTYDIYTTFLWVKLGIITGGVGFLCYLYYTGKYYNLNFKLKIEYFH